MSLPPIAATPLSILGPRASTFLVASCVGASVGCIRRPAAKPPAAAWRAAAAAPISRRSGLPAATASSARPSVNRQHRCRVPAQPSQGASTSRQCAADQAQAGEHFQHETPAAPPRSARPRARARRPRSLEPKPANLRTMPAATTTATAKAICRPAAARPVAHRGPARSGVARLAAPASQTTTQAAKHR